MQLEEFPNQFSPRHQINYLEVSFELRGEEGRINYSLMKINYSLMKIN